MAAQAPQWAGQAWGGAGVTRKTASHRTVIILYWVQGMGNPTCLPVCPSSRSLLQSMFALASHIYSQCEPQEARATLGLESFLCSLGRRFLGSSIPVSGGICIQTTGWPYKNDSGSRWGWWLAGVPGGGRGGWEASHPATAWQRDSVYFPERMPSQN